MGVRHRRAGSTRRYGEPVALGIAATVTAAVSIVGASGSRTASAEPVSLTLHYTCTFSGLGNQPVTMELESDIPNSMKVGKASPKSALDGVATVGASFTQLAALAGAKTLEGSLDGNATVTAPQGSIPLTVPMTIPRTPIPPSGSVRRHRQGHRALPHLQPTGQREGHRWRPHFAPHPEGRKRPHDRRWHDQRTLRTGLRAEHGPAVARHHGAGEGNGNDDRRGLLRDDRRDRFRRERRRDRSRIRRRGHHGHAARSRVRPLDVGYVGYVNYAECVGTQLDRVRTPPPYRFARSTDRRYGTGRCDQRRRRQHGR